VSELWFPAAIAVAALGLTYLFCLRPMRRGQCMTALPQRREQPLTSIQRRTGAAVGAVALAGLLGGGVAYAATQVTDPPGARSADSTSAGPASTEMMAGGGMGMGSFTRDAPFDAQFLDQMIVHHQGAIMSTQAMIADSTRPELRALAGDIITSQRAQLKQMKTWRAQWYPDLAPTFAMGGGMMSGSMMGDRSADGGGMMSGSMMGDRSADGGGMMSGSMMGNGATGMMGGSMMGGPGTDRMYLQMMIVHHQLAVDMAEQARTQATHPGLRGLAAAIATEQAAQITQMRGYLAALPAGSQD